MKMTTANRCFYKYACEKFFFPFFLLLCMAKDIMTIVDMLNQGYSYSEIKRKLNVGNSLISRCSGILNELRSYRNHLLDLIHQMESYSREYNDIKTKYRGGFSKKLIEEISAKINLAVTSAEFIIKQLQSYYSELEPWLSRTYLSYILSQISYFRSFLTRIS